MSSRRLRFRSGRRQRFRISRRQRFRSGTAAVLAALLCVWLGSVALAQDGAAQDAAAQNSAAQDAAATRQVSTAVAQLGAVTTSRTTSVTIEPARDAQVAATASGQVERVLVREGAAVAAGQVVIQVDDANLRLQVENARIARDTAAINLAAAQRASGEGVEQARAALTAAEANLDLARRQYEQARQLYEVGAVSATELAGLEAQLAQAQSAAQQARDAVARAERVDTEELELRRLQVQQAENQLAQAQRALADAQVRAPFDGSIAQVNVEEGEFIAAGSPAFRLIDDRRQRARFSVPPQDAQALLSQGLIHIPFGGLDYAAQVTDSSDVPNQARLVEMTATIYEASTRIPNGTVTPMSYQVPLAQGVTVPLGALRYSGAQTLVFAVVGGRAEAREVVVLAEGDGLAVVEGVAQGAIVVNPLPADLISGSPVTAIGGTTSQ